MEWINSMFEVATGKTTRDESFKYGNKEFKSKGILYYNKYKTLGYMVSNSRSNNGLKSLLSLFLEMFTSLNDPLSLEYTFHTCFMFDEDRLLLNCAKPYKNNSVNLKPGSIAERLRNRRANQKKDYEEINVDQMIQEFKFTSQDMIKALVTISVQFQCLHPKDNICNDVYYNACLREKLSLEEYYQSLLEEKLTIEKPSKPKLSESDKKNLKERSRSNFKGHYKLSKITTKYNKKD